MCSGSPGIQAAGLTLVCYKAPRLCGIPHTIWCRVVWADWFSQQPLQTGKQRGQKKLTTYLGRKLGLLTDVDANDDEGEFWKATGTEEIDHLPWP